MKSLNRFTFFSVVFFAVFATGASAFEPTSNYSRLNINGWTVFVSSKFAANSNARNSIIRKVQQQTDFVSKSVSSKHLKVLQKSALWLEADKHYRSLARYHGSKGGIYQEELNIEKYRDIEVFGNFSSVKHNSLILHELAHAYHDRKLHSNNARLGKIFKNFETNYPTAKDRCSKPRKAYGLTNEHEFFATFTEGYFGEVCRYPYNKATIQKYHPDMFAFLTKIWGK